MASTDTPDVLIAGAGPTALVLACELARRGTTVRIIEKEPAFRRESRGKGLNPRSREVLADLGVGAVIDAVGTPHLVMRKYRHGIPVADSEPYDGRHPQPDRPYDSNLLIPQWYIEETLRARLADYGTDVELGAELAAFEQDAEGVTARLADGRTVRARYLVGCDGGRSTVRKALPVSFDGTTSPTQVMLVGDVEAPGLPRDVWHQWLDEDGGVMLCPLPGTDGAFQVQGIPEFDAQGDPVAPSLEVFQRLFERYSRRSDIRLRNATWLSTYRVNERMVDRYRVGRVLLAGDAAHVHAIAGGLGMNTGIQDAHNLGWKLALVAAGRAGTGLLDSYEQERLPIAAWVLRTSRTGLDRATEAVQQAGKGIEAVMVDGVDGLGLGYRWSALAGQDGLSGEDPDAGPRPGDRAPDAPCHDPATGAPRRLFQVFERSDFVLLGFGARAAAAARAVQDAHPHLVRGCGIDGGGPGTAPGADLVDAGGHAHRAYGLAADGAAEEPREGLVLVRPDNHVALTAAPDGAPAVHAYLDGLATRPGQ